MSDKKIEVSNIERQPDFLKKLAQTAKKANESLAFGQKIANNLNPEVMPDDVYLSGYCANATLYFVPLDCASTMTEILNSIIEAYPPIECVFVPSTPTVKPKKDLRDSEVGQRAYPIRVDSKDGHSTVVWWTQLTEDVTACIQVPGSMASPTPEKWEVKSQSYALGHHCQYWVPRQKRESDIKVLGPRDKWFSAIDTWVTAEAYRQERSALVKHFTHAAQYGHEIVAPTVGAFVLPEYESLTEEQKYEFLSYFKNHSYNKVHEEEQAEVEKAKEWLDAFFRAHGPIQEKEISPVGFSALAYLLKKETNTTAAINWITRKYQNGPFEVGITLNKAHVRFNATHDTAKPYLELDAMAEYYC